MAFICAFADLAVTESLAVGPSLPILPNEYPELVRIPFDVTETQASGAISGTLRETDYNSLQRPDYYCEVLEMPFRVETCTREFDCSTVDAATDWTILTREWPEERCPIAWGIYALENLTPDLTVTRFWNQNIAFFNGKEWTIYIFSDGWIRYFVKTDCVLASRHGFYFGSKNGSYWADDDEAQGICQMTAQGVVKRVFWPPLLKKWRSEQFIGTYFTTSSKEHLYWDITSLEACSHNTLWAGLWGGVIRLDLEKDRWQLFDETNSPIDQYIAYIASVSGQDMVRCVGRDPNGYDFMKMPQRGFGNIYRIQTDNVIREDMGKEAKQALNETGPIISDSSGCIWFIGSGAVWKSDMVHTERIIDLPASDCRYACTDPSGRIRGNDFASIGVGNCNHLLKDSWGRLWVADLTRVWVLGKEGWVELTEEVFRGNNYEDLKIHCLGEDVAKRIWVCWQYPAKGEWAAKSGASILSKLGRERLEKRLRESDQSD